MNFELLLSILQFTANRPKTPLFPFFEEIVIHNIRALHSTGGISRPPPPPRSSSTGPTSRRFRKFNRTRTIAPVHTRLIGLPSHARILPPRHTEAPRLHLHALPPQTFRTPTQIDPFAQVVCPIDCGDFDLRELIGDDGVVVTGGQPVGDDVG